MTVLFSASEERMGVEYYFASSVNEAITLLQRYGDEARLIAGGTDLMLLLEKQHRRPQALVDVTRIPELQRLEVDGRSVSIGAGVTYSQLLDHPLICERVPFLTDAIRQIGGVQIRNVATLVGNVTNGSPAGDTLPPLYTLGTLVHVEGGRGSRSVPIEEFVLGVRHIALESSELVTHVTFRLPDSSFLGTFEKVGLRRAMAIAVASVAALLRTTAGRVDEARIALGAVAPTVIRVPEVERFLVGRALDDETIERAVVLSMRTACPIDDIRSSLQYRRRAVGGLMRRALRHLRSRIVAKE